MGATDVFRTELQNAIAGIRYWVPSLRHVAELKEDDELPAYWRLAARPHLGSACPFDLILHESAAFDVTIGPETYDGLPVSDLALFGPLLAAIAEGKVITRTWSTVGTGQVRRVETIVQPNGCEMWRQVRDEPAFAAVPLEACVRHDRHYTPFTRAGAASA